MFKIEDLVFLVDDSRKNLFIINEIKSSFFIIFGVNNRMIKVVTKDEIVLATKEEIELIYNKEKELREKVTKNIPIRKNIKAVYGRVLHIDGDNTFLSSCINLYNETGVFAYGVNLKEKDIYKYIKKLILELRPDIIVMTGHDVYNGKGLSELENYENSYSFIKAINIIRKINNNVVVIAGACGSNFEALIASGANIASSPKRINIHTYDPAIAAIKVATTPFDQKVNYNNIYKYIENGHDALGGLELYGKMNLLM